MVRIVFEGCGHGNLNAIYSAIQSRYKSIEVDLVLIGGDFEALRNEQDLNCLAVPAKYRLLGDFHDYYHGRKKAPYLTILIGGNHEASNYMQELPYGGWVAPNMYYLGYCGVVRYGSLRIGGLSGIFNSAHYKWDHIEKVPYDRSTERSVYHIRYIDVQKLMMLKPRTLDIMLSHDWPAGITSYGDLPSLLKIKPFFRKDIETGQLGSPPAMDLLHKLAPAHWLSAHLHCRFTAVVPHGTSSESKVVNPDEIDLDDLDDDKEPVKEDGSSKQIHTTEFLALDKCLPKRRFIELLEITALNPGEQEPEKPRLQYDPDWLAVIKAFHGLKTNEIPSQDVLESKIAESLEWINENVSQHKLTIPQNFSAEVPPLSRSDPNYSRLCQQQPPLRMNNQTKELYELLDLEPKSKSEPKP